MCVLCIHCEWCVECVLLNGWKQRKLCCFFCVLLPGGGVGCVISKHGRSWKDEETALQDRTGVNTNPSVGFLPQCSVV